MITLTDTALEVRAPISYRNLLATIPGARWNKKARAWTYPRSPMVAEELDRRLPRGNGKAQALEPLLDLRAAQESAPRDEPLPFDSPHPAWKHQREAYWYAASLPAALLWIEMGGGKSRIAVDLVLSRAEDFTLIVCPKAVIPVWERQFEEHAWRDYALIAPKGGTDKKARQVERFLESHHNLPRVVVLNYESVWRAKLGKLLLRTPPTLVVADEIHRIKAPGGRTSRWMAQLAERAPKRLGLSGTPCPHSPLDAYGVFRFLDPGIFGTSFARFRSRYAVMGGYTVNEQPVQVVGWQNEDDYHRRFHSITYRARSEDLLDLPPVLHHTIEVTLPPGARRVYEELRTEFVTEVEAGVITVANAAVKVLRLQQVTSGFVQGEEAGERIVEALHTSKQDALHQLLEDLPTEEPVVVFCRFTRDLDAVHAATTAAGRKSAELSGRINHLDTWQAGQASVLAVQIQAGAEGIDLTRACYAVYYSIGYSLGQYEQSLARLHRPGQDRHVHYYHLIADRTIDEQVYKALDRRKDVLTYLLEGIHA